MYLEEDDLVVSPTDMVAFTECTHVTWLDRLAAAGRIERPTRDDPMLELLRGRGQDHETRYLEHLRALGLDVADVAEHRGAGDGGDGALTRRERLRGRAGATRAAMQSGQDIVFQATFLDESHSPNWRGHADFLRRVETPSDLGGWSYEPEDTKLARLLKASAVLQLAVYAEQIAEVQGRPPESIHVVLGDMARASIRLDEVAAYHRHVRARFEQELTRSDDEYPTPTNHCSVCRWAARCGQRWDDDDHLSRVAFITRENVRRLEEAGIATLAALATAPAEPVPTGITTATFARLRSQAGLQHRRAPGEPPPWEFILTDDGEVEENRGLAALPTPDPGDLFYDIEGHPYAVDGGLEYLHGVGWMENGTFAFEGGWAHDPHAERRVFEQLIDHIVERRRTHPGMHVYHYAPYETTAIGKLMGRHGSREREVDTLLREDVFVDLYRVVRQGLRIGSRSYSIKKLEPLYMRPREGDIGTGGSSIVAYEQWLQTGDPQILQEIEDYNRDDVESTVLLRDWLEDRRRDLEASGVHVPRPVVVEPESTGWEDEELDDLLERLAGDRDELLPGSAPASSDERTPLKPVTARNQQAPGDPGSGPTVVSARVQSTDPASEPPITPGNEFTDGWTTASSGAWTTAGSIAAGDDETAARWLLADLLQWHRREDKPEWWRYFARIHDYEPDDFVDDIETVGGLQLEGVVEQVRRSYVWRYRFDPDQDCKLTPGNIVIDPDHARALAVQGLGRKTSTVHDVDPTAGTIDIIRSTQWDGPHPSSLAPSGPLSTTALRAALRYVANALLDHGVDGPGPARAARQLLARRRPQIIGGPAGAPLRLPSESAGDAAIRVVGSLDHSYLPVQGPPGSGKTYSAADVVLDLVERGQRVGITAFTHHAITNLLEEITAHARARGLAPRIMQKTSKGKRAADDDLITLVTGADDVVNGLTSSDIIAGTAWLWARQDLRSSIDTLIVDEAGQLSLANVLAVSTSCRNLVLVGDPQQLSQPSKGVHPEGAGATALEHVLGGRRTVPPDRGLLLDRTWRMHPDVCAFISEQVYEGRLTSQDHLDVQRIGGDDHWAGAGLRWVPVRHRGNRTSSLEEIEVIDQIVRALLGRSWVDDKGNERTLGLDDILVVAPYNAQVHRLAAALPSGSRVGTVDSFQGQEAAVAILSMATSSAEDAPRGMEFLYSTNRINVAVSRARALSIVVGSPYLLSAPCSSVGQIRMVNVLCRYAELAREVHASAL